MDSLRLTIYSATVPLQNFMQHYLRSMLITHDDLVKISDFGTSKELSDKSTKMSFAGTVAWMAPEVIRNEPVSEKVDIW